MQLEIVGRERWGARYARGQETNGAKTRFVAHHDSQDRSQPEATLAEDIAVMRFLEHYHVNERPEKLVGIAYSFVIMQSGRVFEGRGWGRVGGHTKGLNSSAYAACFPINGNRTRLTSVAIAAFHALRQQGVALVHLAPNHIVSGHRDHGTTDCPGTLVYEQLVKATPVPEIVPDARQAIAAHPTLRLGKGGVGARPPEQAAVRALQQRLVAWRALDPRHATGYFGPITDEAVRRVQQQQGLIVDGIVGPQTYRVLGL